MHLGISGSILTSFVNKTLRYTPSLEAATHSWPEGSSPFFIKEPWPQIWRCWLYSQLLHSRLQTAPAHAEDYGQMKAKEPHRLQKRRDANEVSKLDTIWESPPWSASFKALSTDVRVTLKMHISQDSPNIVIHPWFLAKKKLIHFRNFIWVFKRCLFLKRHVSWVQEYKTSGFFF